MEYDKEKTVSNFIQIFFIKSLWKILVMKIRRQYLKLPKENVSTKTVSFKFSILVLNVYRYIRCRIT